MTSRLEQSIYCRSIGLRRIDPRDARQRTVLRLCIVFAQHRMQARCLCDIPLIIAQFFPTSQVLSPRQDTHGWTRLSVCDASAPLPRVHTEPPLETQLQPRARRKLQRHLWHSARFSNIAYTYLIFKLSVIFLETTNGTCAGILVVFPPGNRILYSLKKKNPHLKTLHIIHHGRFVSFMFLLYGYRLCSRSTLVAAHPRITAYPISPYICHCDEWCRDSCTVIFTPPGLHQAWRLKLSKTYFPLPLRAHRWRVFASRH